MLDAVTIPLDGRVSFITPILTEFRILMSLDEYTVESPYLSLAVTFHFSRKKILGFVLCGLTRV